MDNIDVLETYKIKNGLWECRDQQGRTARGATKQIAMNIYYALYQIKTPPACLDLSKFNQSLK